MVDTSNIHSAVAKLRAALASVSQRPEVEATLKARDSVLARYQELFAYERIGELSERDFAGFLLLKNNRHWTGLARKGSSLCNDMSRVREALLILLDETRPLKERLDCLLPKTGPPFMKNLGRALITAVLHVTHPEKYGVYNGTSEAGMKLVGVFPKFERGAPFSERYLAVNHVLRELATKLQIDLWTLDVLWWCVKTTEEEDNTTEPLGSDVDEDEAMVFGLEKYLQHFLCKNWDHIPLSEQWVLLEEDGDLVGCEYNTGEIGTIDLLAKHKCEPRWLVIELKRDRTSDVAVGQLLRYMGWVRKNRASEGETVEGLIIAHEADVKLGYAVLCVPNVSFMSYRIDFQLREVPGIRT